MSDTPLQLLVFVTDDGTPSGSGPMLFIVDDPTYSLPPNPRALNWKYVRNLTHEHPSFATEGQPALDAVRRDGYYISHRLV